ncbi:MAG: peptidyl-prolyl cis-trans isomerase [Armatimonadota bacterium]
MKGTSAKILPVVLAAVALASMVTGCGRKTVAKIDGVKITRDEYCDRLERMRVPAGPGGQTAEAGALVLQRLIDETLVVKLAESEKVGPTNRQVDDRMAEVKRQPGFKERLRQSGLSTEQFKQMLKVEQAVFNLQTKDIKVTDKEVRGYYDKNKAAKFTVPEHLQVSVIVAKNQADANKAMTMLKKGVKFSTVVNTISADPASAGQGGRIPPITRDDKRFPSSILSKLFNTPEGKTTEPIAIGKGASVIFGVDKHNNRRVIPFRDRKYAIRQELMIKKGMEKGNNVDEMLAKFRDKAKINVRIDRYKDILLQKATSKVRESATEATGKK